MVVLPAPFGPSSEKISPLRTENEILSTALSCPYDFSRDLTSIADIPASFSGPFHPYLHSNPSPYAPDPIPFIFRNVTERIDDQITLEWIFHHRRFLSSNRSDL